MKVMKSVEQWSVSRQNKTKFPSGQRLANEAAQVSIGKPWKAILDCNEKLVLPSACKQIFLLYKLPSVWMNLQKFVE
jgi:hypothetical protein